jgi:hypothetical protein
MARERACQNQEKSEANSLYNKRRGPPQRVIVDALIFKSFQEVYRFFSVFNKVG